LGARRKSRSFIACDESTANEILSPSLNGLSAFFGRDLKAKVAKLARTLGGRSSRRKEAHSSRENRKAAMEFEPPYVGCYEDSSEAARVNGLERGQACPRSEKSKTRAVQRPDGQFALTAISGGRRLIR
jgi:hypothetical protein